MPAAPVNYPRPAASGRLPQASWLRPLPPPCSVSLVVHETNVYCNGAVLELARRPTMLRLFAAFLAAPAVELSLGDIVALVYNIDPAIDAPLHYTDKTYGRCIRLISRARAQAARRFAGVLPGSGAWFVYDAERRSWQLYREALAAPTSLTPTNFTRGGS